MFQADDLVMSKIGGPVMIVHGCGDVASKPHVWCRWRDAGGQEINKVFAEHEIIPAPSEERPAR